MPSFMNKDFVSNLLELITWTAYVPLPLCLTIFERFELKLVYDFFSKVTILHHINALKLICVCSSDLTYSDKFESVSGTIKIDKIKNRICNDDLL